MPCRSVWFGFHTSTPSFSALTRILCKDSKPLKQFLFNVEPPSHRAKTTVLIRTKELFELMQHRTPAKSLMQVLHTTALLVALCAIAAPAHARQLMDGLEGIKAYGIEYNSKTIGTVVVVGRDNPNPPPGYTAGREYWAWVPGAAWRGTFTLVPVDTVPDYYSSNWATFPHDRFDLSRTVPMPSISPEPGDRFYRVQVQNGSRWIDQGWMWLDNGDERGDERRQEWYGRNLTSDLVGDGTAIRFTSADPPKPGSPDVYLLIH